jgi:hypothetical protein
VATRWLSLIRTLGEKSTPTMSPILITGKGPMMLHILIDNPLLTFSIVAALGYLLGRVRIGDSSLGTAAVLFAGLFVGAIDPRLKLPDALYLLGVVIGEGCAIISSE